MPDLLGPSLGRERLRRNLGKKRVDDRVTLLRRHVILDRSDAVLAIDDIIADQAIEIGGEIVRVGEDDIDVEEDARLDVDRCRNGADRLPECRGFVARAVQILDEQMLDLTRGAEMAAPYRLL